MNVLLRRIAAINKVKPPQEAPAPSISPEQVREKLKGRGRITSGSDIERILGLPIIEPLDIGEREEFNRNHLLARSFDKGFRLFDIQADALAAFEMTGGLFGGIGVGWGKTLLTLMIAQTAYVDRGCRKIMLQIPSQVYIQLMQKDIRWARGIIPMSYPIYALGGRSRAARVQMATSGRDGLYILPYSLLSVPDTRELIDGIMPELVIADEAQNLANRRAARTRRVMEYINDHTPLGVAVSGTLTRKGVADYYHLMRWCCGMVSPLPLIQSTAFEWGEIIDSDASQINEESPITPDSSGTLHQIIQWARREFPKDPLHNTVAGFRRAYNRRMTTSPSVVCSSDAEIGTSLIIHNTPVAKYKEAEGWTVLNELITQVDELWVTPNGDEIEYAIHCWKWLNELSAGFYNQLTWPTEEKVALSKQVDDSEAEALLLMSMEAHTAHQHMARMMRMFFDQEDSPLDTPMLVANDMARNGSENVPQELYSAWSEWHALLFEGMPERESTAVRVCSYKIDAAVEWAKSLRKGGLIWYYHQEVGRWIYEQLRVHGVDVLHCPAGNEHNGTIIDLANQSKMVVASISAHGTGKNLQHFSEQFIIQWPRSAGDAEQMLGRTHRNGQMADELIVNLCKTLPFDAINFGACLNDALYVHQTMGNKQKIIYAGYDPLPEVFPTSVLRQRGLETRVLTSEQERILRERFDMGSD